MADAALRDLERRAATTNEPSDEARVLLERVRLGTLDQERLALAAYVGHPAALLACPGPEAPRCAGGACPGPDAPLYRSAARCFTCRATIERGGGLMVFADGLQRWGQEAQALAACAAARSASCLWDPSFRDLVERCCSAGEAWVRSAARWPARAEEWGAAWLAADLEGCGEVAPSITDLGEGSTLGATLRHCAQQHPLGGEGVRSAVRDAVSAWALA